MRVPKSFSARSPRSRQDLASTLRNKLKEQGTDPAYERRSRGQDEDPEVRRLRTRLREHPCHGCAEREDHARWAERYFRLAKETDALRRRVEGRSHVISRTFDRVCGVLEDLDYLSGDAVSEEGGRLAKIYSELDLLVAECLRRDVWKDLTPPELAACVASLVYEARRNDDAYPRLPGGRIEETLAEMVRLWGELHEVESRHRVSFLRQPDLGFVWTAHRWARGDRLDAILRQADMPAGDFVRTAKMLVDMLSQIAGAAGDTEVRANARRAADLVRRGVVAYTSLT
jgi:ATP-dependent RNA helicase HelY